MEPHGRRLRVLARTFCVAPERLGAATTVDLEAPAAAEEAPVLLDDAAVKRFLVDGMLALPLTDLPVGFHRELQRSSRVGYERLQDAGLEDRYVYNELPAMSEVLASPLTRGALVSLLGPGYVQHPHRSMHVQGEIEDGMPRLGDGGWHKDGHHVPMRHHFPRWIIGFYYPFPCTMDMGPTGVIPGSHWLSVGTYNDGGWSGEPADPDTVLPDDIVAAHDMKLRASAAALYPGAVERKTAVGDLADPEYGTLFLLNFGILHRRCTRLPGSLWRNMFKLQFFRTAAPTSPSWDHDGAHEDSQPFAHTDASPEQQAVYEAAWSWMKGDSVPPPTVNHLAAPPRLEADLLGDLEHKRVASAYSLGRHAAGGDASALDMLEAALCGEGDDASRSAMYGCGGAGDMAVPMLCRALARARRASDWRTQINAAHALNEAVRTPSKAVQVELQATLESAVAAMESCVCEDQGGISTPTASENTESKKVYHEKTHPEAAHGYLTDPERAEKAAGIRRTLTTCIQALGTLGERAVASGDAALVGDLVDVLLPYTVAPEPGAALESFHINGRALAGIRPGQSEFWAREGAAIGLLRLASAAPDDVSLVTPSTPGHHGDDRFIPALCQYALARAEAGVGVTRADVVDKMKAYSVQWASLADATGAESQEPWLQSLGESPGGGSGVAWLA